MAAPVIQFDRIAVRRARLNFVDLHIFQRWRLHEEPAMLLGMDALGVLDTLVIDHPRRELRIKLLEG